MFRCDNPSFAKPFSWQQCCICERADGAVIRCSDCSKEFHVSCAWKQGYRFGFEIQHVSLLESVHVPARSDIVGSGQEQSTRYDCNDDIQI